MNRETLAQVFSNAHVEDLLTVAPKIVLVLVVWKHSPIYVCTEQSHFNDANRRLCTSHAI